MKEHITKVVRYRPNTGRHEITDDGDKKNLWYSEIRILMEWGYDIPKERSYVVTYQLDPKGKFKVAAGCGIPDIHPVEKERGINYINVCFLPVEWAGETVTRTVRVFPKKEDKVKEGR